MKTVKEMIEVMQAYADGKVIEVDLFPKEDSEWVVVTEPSWDWFRFDYRVKKIEPEVGKKYTFLNTFNRHTRTCIALGQKQVVFGPADPVDPVDKGGYSEFLTCNLQTFNEYVGKGQIKCVK